MSLLPPARVQRRAVARVTRMTAENASPARLSYALIIILSFQALLFTCLLASLAGFLMLTFFDLTGRVGEIERMAATMPTPAVSSLEEQPLSPLPTPTTVDVLPSVEQPVSPLANDDAPPTDTVDEATIAPTDTPTFMDTPTSSSPITTTPENVAPPPDVATPTLPAPTNMRGVTLHVLQNSGQSELLELRNEGADIVDVSNWRLFGSLNLANITCIIPGATSLPPGGVFQIASGDASPIVQGYICADVPIWDDNTEIIFLTANDGQTIQVEANLVQPPTPIAETPSPTPTLAAPSPSAPNVNSVTATLLQNSGQSELLELHNVGAEPIDISGWRLYSNNAANITCNLPAGTSLPPNGVFQIANGDSSPTGQGYTCAPSPIWDDAGETIFFASNDGQTIQVGANPTQTPAIGETPPQTPVTNTTPSTVTSSLQGITLTIVENSGQFELLELRNVGTETVNISSWQLSGRLNPQNMPCIIPGGTSVPPNSIFQIVSGESPLTGPGHTCANTPIWSDTGESISLTASDGQSIVVQAGPMPP